MGSDKAKLKACPFCGDRPGHGWEYNPSLRRRLYFVECTCGGKVDFKFTQGEAVKCWNRRAKAV